MKNLVYLSFFLLVFSFACGLNDSGMKRQNMRFIQVQGTNLISPDAERFFIRGINLNNWLNPDGELFLLKGFSSYKEMNNAFEKTFGTVFMNWFWTEFRESYITQQDIQYIKKTGMNSIRLPFHYTLFTDERCLGLKSDDEAFELIDRLLDWCREEGVYVILDMHGIFSATENNDQSEIPVSPSLMNDEDKKLQFCTIWKKIAAHYERDTIILGYNLIGNPSSHYFLEEDILLNDSLEPLYKRCVDSIRTVDKNHIVMLAGAQWNSNFSVFTDATFDDKIMYTCHRYWCDTLQTNIQDFVHFRDSVNLPMYMRETGENTFEWISAWTRLLEKNNIGWHYWPYKKLGSDKCMLTITMFDEWRYISEYFVKKKEVSDPEMLKEGMVEFLENLKHRNCIKNEAYILAMGMKP